MVAVDAYITTNAAIHRYTQIIMKQQFVHVCYDTDYKEMSKK